MSAPFVGVPRGDVTAVGFGDEGAAATGAVLAAAAAAVVAVATPPSAALPSLLVDFRSDGEIHSGVPASVATV